MNSKDFEALGHFPLHVRVSPASPAGRPQPASAGRRSWELVLALIPPGVVVVVGKETGSHVPLPRAVPRMGARLSETQRQLL